MSNYVDRFIKQHREYFIRNKTVIDKNSWHEKDTGSQSQIDFLFEQISEIKNRKTPKKDDEATVKKLQKEIFSLKERTSKKRETLFKEENSLTNSILGRLSAFIQETEKNGDRALPKVQRFIDTTVDIIKIHTDKCDLYLDYSLDDLTKEPDELETELRSEEIKFQDEVFNCKIKTQDSLDKLNITNSIENIKVQFFKDEKSSLLMKEPLVLKIPIVKKLTNEIYPSLNIRESNEMLFNMKEKDIPTWNPDKHFWEQEKSTLEFWEEERNKIQRGINIGGYFIHPWLYWHLNIFKTKIPLEDGTEPTINPYFRDNEWFFVENLKIAEDLGNRGMLLYGTRRFTKSVILASYVQFKAFTKFNAIATVTGGSDGDLADLTDKIKDSMTYMPHALNLSMISQNWDNGDTYLGLKKDASNPIVHSIIKVKNFSSGAKKSSQKAAGGAPSAFVNDEIGKYAFLKSYLAALPSFETPYGFKTVPILAGTAGEASLSSDAMKVLANPEKYNLLPMQWDLLESKIDPEHITWKRRNFATFVPAQMAYKKGFVKKQEKLSTFLNKPESKELSRYNIQVTDWGETKQKIKEFRKEAENDSLLLQQRTVQYPIDPEEVFLSAESNPFPYKQAQKHKEYLLETGKWDKRRFISFSDDGELQFNISTMPLAPYPHTGGTLEAPLLVFEAPPEQTPVDNLYVASFDDVKQDDSDTDSLVNFSIWKMPTFADEWGDRLVLSWTCRPQNRQLMYRIWLSLQKKYNARAFPENEDMGYKTYLENKFLDEQLLCSAVDFTSKMNITSNNKRKYGWTPKQSKKTLLGMFVSYCNEIIEEEDGKTIMGVQKIDDIGLLDEIINFNNEGNFDRISGTLGSIGWMHYLQSNWILPKLRSNSNKPKKKVEKGGFYSKNRKGNYLYKK